MASLTYDSESKTFNAEIAITQTESESTVSNDDIAESKLGEESKLEDEFSDKNIVPDSNLMYELYQDSISEEVNEKISSEKTKCSKKTKDLSDPKINIKLNLIKKNSQPIETNFFLHKGQNILSNHKCDLIPNVLFDVNRVYTESEDDNTYITVDVYKKTIKQTEVKMSQSEKPIGQLRLKLESHMKEKTSKSLDHNDSLITFTAFRKRLN